MITVPLAGACQVIHETGELFVDASQLLFHSPGVPYSTRHPLGTGDDGCNFAYADSVVEEALDRASRAGSGSAVAAARCREIGPPRPFRLPMQELVATRLLEYVGSDDPTLDPLLAEELGLLLLEAIVAGPETRTAPGRSRRASTRSFHGRLVDRTRALLHEETAKGWSLAQIGREVGSSPYHLARIFRARTGRSIHEYRARLRLVAAIDAILATPDRRLDEIALETGFSSHGHLCSEFARRVGNTPSSFRESPLRLLRDRLRDRA